ncbi:DUF7563 family protein [Halomontanus rarus]|uniref:DUF7563 family protein n=1 Tax=Halomontanus rarus TaxID=3034020 RepID=UPI0023E7B9E8|nr:hypothetical protein [Halovivax sp. TS33]
MSRSNAPQWTPREPSPSPGVCQNCGTEHTLQFARVFGDSTDTLFHCEECDNISYRDLKQGAGSDPDYDPAVDRGTASENTPIFNRGDSQ